MIPQIYSWLNVSAVNAIAETRLYPFNDAGDSPTYPYVVWQFVSSQAQNQLSGTPGMDNDRVQIDCYARDQQTVLDLAEAVRDAMDPRGHQLTRIDHGIDPDTKSYRLQFDYSIWMNR